MPIKQTLQKIYRKLFISEHYYQVKFQVLNIHDKDVWRKYHYSVGYFCEEVILCKGRLPSGSLDILGHDKTSTIDIAYNKRLITAPEIRRFLEGYKIEVKQIKNIPFHKIFGTFYRA